MFPEFFNSLKPIVILGSRTYKGEFSTACDIEGDTNIAKNSWFGPAINI